MTTIIEPERTEASRTTRFLALDLTRAFQATCDHCYNSSVPSGTAGSMTREDWLNVLDQAADMGGHAHPVHRRRSDTSPRPGGVGDPRPRPAHVR